MQTNENRQIGIYGGTFDPVHIGHLIVAQNAINTCLLDKVIFIPAYNPPHKRDRSDTAIQRLEMLYLAIEENPQFEIDEREIRSKQIRYTLSTMNDLIAENPNTKFYYIVGEDSILQIETWYRWRDLLELVDMIVVKRPNSYEIAREHNEKKHTLQEKIDYLKSEGYHIHVIGDFPVDISSTKIRENISLGKSIQYVVPEKVIDYIKEEGLYE